MKKKVVLVGALSLALATTGAVAWASATQENAPTPESSVVESQPVDTPITNYFGGGNTITPYVIDKEPHYTAGPGTSDNNYFTVNPGSGHLKLFMKNYSSHPVTVNLTHIANSFMYFSKTIPANSNLSWISFNEGYPQGVQSGSYVLQWIGGSYEVNGEVFIKLASSTGDF